MALALFVVVGIMFAVGTFAIPPKYESVATLYILKQSEGQGGNANSNEDFSLALMVVNDCNHLLKGHSVLDEVIDNLDLDMSYDQLRSSVSVVNPSETRILEVKVRSSSPELSKRIVDEICDVGMEKIDEAMGSRQVNLYEYGVLDHDPCNRIGLLAYLLAGVGSALLVYIIFMFVYIFDDKIRDDEEIEKNFHLSILGEIPDANITGKRKSKYQRYYAARYQRYEDTSSEKEEK